MPQNESFVTMQRILAIEALFRDTPTRQWSSSELAERFQVTSETIRDNLRKICERGVITLAETEAGGRSHRWFLDPNVRAPLEPLHLDYAQGAALYAATRLLSQQHDERNDAIRTTIYQIIAIMPTEMQATLLALATDLDQRSANRPEVSATFLALSQGWLMRRRVMLTYEPAHGAVYQCHFDPYLLEPSGIGYTIYFIGHSDPPGALRTYKLERIRHAALTEETFTIPTDFDGPALLNRAWGVMYGEGELVQVRLRFTPYVARRVRETRWHLSERVTGTPDGLVWEADIGDITEIRPWIRGWGSDCEVLAPATLRDEMQQEIRRMARTYGIAFTSPGGDAPDQSLMDDLFS